MSASSIPRTKVFISYCRADKEWLERLRVHLKPLERAGIVDSWDDTRIKSGDHWQEKIKEVLASTCVAVLLISPDFMASDFICDNELPPLLSAEKTEGLIVIPVIISHSLFNQSNLSQFQATNPPSEPMIDLPKGAQDKLWVKVANDIQGALKIPPP